MVASTFNAQAVLNAAARKVQPIIDGLDAWWRGGPTDTVNNGTTDLPSPAKLVADTQAQVAGVTDEVNTSRDAAAGYAAEAQATFASFTDLWQGGLAADPAFRPDGSALVVADVYFNTTSHKLRVYKGAAWGDYDESAQAAAAAAQNAMANKGVYKDTASGIAATVNGQTFGVLSTSLTGAYDLYNNVSGVAVATGKTVPNDGAVAAVQAQVTAQAVVTNLFDPSQIYFFAGKRVQRALVDPVTRTGWVLTEDGYFYAKLAFRSGANVTLTKGSDGFYTVALGTVDGILPIGSTGVTIDATTMMFYGGKRVQWAKADALGRVGVALTDDGYLYVPKLVAGNIPIDTSQVLFYSGKRVEWAKADALGRAGIVLTEDGSVYIPKLISGSVAGAPIEQIASSSNLYQVQLVGAQKQIFKKSRTGAGKTQMTTAGNNFGISLSYDGNDLLYSSDRSGSVVPYYQPVSLAYESLVHSSKSIVIAADSRGTRELGFVNALAALYPSRIIDCEAVGGQRSAEIAARFISITTIVSGNLIPASGGVSCSPGTNPDPFWHWDSASGAIHGVMQGVPGTLSYVLSTNTTTFTRDAAGVAVVVPSPAIFVPDSGTIQTSTSAAGAPSLLAVQQYLAIIAPGYNDLFASYIEGIYTYSRAALLANIDAIVAALKPLVPHFIIPLIYVGEQVLQQGSGGLAVGQSLVGYSPSTPPATSLAMITETFTVNSILQSKYPNNVVDLQAAFIAAGFGETAIVNGSPVTLVSTAALFDGCHPNSGAGVGAPVIAGALQTDINSLGY